MLLHVQRLICRNIFLRFPCFYPYEIIVMAKIREILFGFQYLGASYDSFLKICLRYIHAMNITTTSVMGNAIHTPVT